METIKSVTHCPTCGSECSVEGDVTHYYVPKNKYTQEEVENLLFELNDQINKTSGELGLGPNSLIIWINKHKKK